MIIYISTNKINDKQYVGQTVKSLNHRKKKHIQRSLYDKNNNYFHNALKKYGSKNFTWEVIHECDTIEELNKLEIYYIGKFDTFDNGYNLTLGGGGSMGRIPSEETRKKISVAGKDKHLGKNNPMYGKRGKNSPTARAVIINNLYFDTLNKAAESTNITPSAIRYRILHKTKWLNHQYADKEQ